jgi:hypothetical protein
MFIFIVIGSGMIGLLIIHSTIHGVGIVGTIGIDLTIHGIIFTITQYGT